MKHISTTTWRDLSDGHLYHEGEPYPFDGREIAPERLAELKDGRNRAGLRLILEAEDNGAEKVQNEQAPETAEKTENKKSAKPAKKTTAKKTAAKAGKAE